MNKSLVITVNEEQTAIVIKHCALGGDTYITLMPDECEQLIVHIRSTLLHVAQNEIKLLKQQLEVTQKALEIAEHELRNGSK